MLFLKTIHCLLFAELFLVQLLNMETLSNIPLYILYFMFINFYSAYVVMIVQPNERNKWDQRQMEYRMWQWYFISLFLYFFNC